jgi:hypothetical protein
MLKSYPSGSVSNTCTFPPSRHSIVRLSLEYLWSRLIFCRPVKEFPTKLKEIADEVSIVRSTTRASILPKETSSNQILETTDKILEDYTEFRGPLWGRKW